jgi:CheY-like chemotaxis protein
VSDIVLGRPVELLLVEDNPGDVELTREALEEARVRNHLHVVTDGEEALEFLRRQGRHAQAPRPDLVLLDLNLPRMSGSDVLAAIKGDPELRRIPVVVLTTSQAEKDVLGAYELHANAYIVKPVDLDQFLGVVRSVEGFWLAVVKFPPE